MSDLTEGAEVEYAVHPVSWQEEGHALPHFEVDEEWRSATVLEVREIDDAVIEGHHRHTHQIAHKLIVRLQPSDGSPPFEVPAPLVRVRQPTATNEPGTTTKP